MSRGAAVEVVQRFKGSGVHRFGFSSSGVQQFRVQEFSGSGFSDWEPLNHRTGEPEPLNL
jgi:hypothetical protein